MRDRDDGFDLDESDDLDDEDEGLDDEGDSDETMPCPHCFATIYDDSERCPHCGEYLSREEIGPRQPPWWVVAGVGVCLVIVFRWIIKLH